MYLAGLLPVALQMRMGGVRTGFASHTGEQECSGEVCDSSRALVVDGMAFVPDNRVLVDGTHRCLAGGPLSLLVCSAIIAFDCLWSQQ